MRDQGLRRDEVLVGRLFWEADVRSNGPGLAVDYSAHVEWGAQGVCSVVCYSIYCIYKHHAAAEGDLHS